MIRKSAAPSARAATIYSVSLSDSTSDRTMRARYIQLVRPMMRIMTMTLPLNVRPMMLIFGSFPPNTFAISSRNSSVGMLSIASVRRIRMESTQPP